MRVGTWNVNGIRAREGEFLDWLAREKPDVACLQEIKLDASQLSFSLGLLADYRSYWHGAGGYSGVSLHLRKESFPETATFRHPSFDAETRIVEAVCGQRVFASVYVPNGGKDFPAKIAFLRAMVEHVRELRASGFEVVIAGDLNVTREPRDVHPSQQNARTIGQRPDERALLGSVLREGGLVDVQRALHAADDALYTWWPYWNDARRENVGWRLDYVLASAALGARAASCTVQTEFGTSDHAPVVAVFD